MIRAPKMTQFIQQLCDKHGVVITKPDASLWLELNDDRLITRRLCYEALYEATREDQGYNPHADAYEREKSVDRWKAWWLRRTGEGLVTTGDRLVVRVGCVRPEPHYRHCIKPIVILFKKK